MKRILLSFVALLATATIGYTQDHVQTTTGFTNTCNNYGVLATNGYTFTSYETGGGGGWGDAKNDTMNYNYYLPASQSAYAWIELNAGVNLSAPNNILDYYIAANGKNGADTTISISVKLESGTGPGTIALSEAYSMTGLTKTYTHQTPTLTVASGQSLAAVTKVTFTIVNNSAVAKQGAFFLTKLKAGSSAVVAGTNSSAALVASSKLYPNPVSDMANVELNLKAVSDVKVTLSDMMGKEVMTIAQGNYSTLNEPFSVADLKKGVYTVNYIVNGAAAKSEMLMVK